MDGSSCAGCSERDARIADLERRLSELEARLRTNASNSSTPPSANPLGADKPVQKKKSKRKRGGQPDHPPHLKQCCRPNASRAPKRLFPMNVAIVTPACRARQIGRFLDDVYNVKRIHSALGYLTPLEFEEQWRTTQEQATMALDLSGG